MRRVEGRELRVEGWQTVDTVVLNCVLAVWFYQPRGRNVEPLSPAVPVLLAGLALAPVGCSFVVPVLTGGCLDFGTTNEH